MIFLIVKIIGCILIVSSSFLIGYSKSKKLYLRRDFLKSFVVFLNSLSTNIRYDSADIFTTVSMSARNNDLTYISKLENNKPFDKQWQEKISSLPNTLALNKSDKELLSEFGNELGKTDIDGQLKHIEFYKNLFDNQLLAAEEDIISKSKLYKTIGLFAGISTALMII